MSETREDKHRAMSVFVVVSVARVIELAVAKGAARPTTSRLVTRSLRPREIAVGKGGKTCLNRMVIDRIR